MHNAFQQFFSHFPNFITILFRYILSYIVLPSPIFKYPNNECKNNQVNNQGLDFEEVIYVGEFSDDEDTKDVVLPQTC